MDYRVNPDGSITVMAKGRDGMKPKVYIGERGAAARAKDIAAAQAIEARKQAIVTGSQPVSAITTASSSTGRQQERAQTDARKQIESSISAMPANTPEEFTAKYEAAQRYGQAYPDTPHSVVTQTRQQLSALAAKDPNALAQAVDMYNKGQPLPPYMEDLFSSVDKYHTRCCF